MEAADAAGKLVTTLEEHRRAADTANAALAIEREDREAERHQVLRILASHIDSKLQKLTYQQFQTLLDALSTETNALREECSALEDQV